MTVASDADAVVTLLVRAAGVFAKATTHPWALVGGVAVMVQLAEAHRATADVDTVVDDDAGDLEDALAVIAADQHGTATGTSLVLEDGTKIDVISTGSWSPGDLPDDELDRMFVLAHWWAVRTAEVVELQVIDDADVAAAARVHVAAPAALVACKLQSCRRRRRDQAKAASDIYDVYRLLVEHYRDGGVARALASAPADFGRWCASALAETFVADSDRSARRLSLGARGPAMAAVRGIDLQVVGSLTSDSITASLGEGPDRTEVG